MSTKQGNKDDQDEMEDYMKNDYIGILVTKTDNRKKSENISEKQVGYYKFSKP